MYSPKTEWEKQMVTHFESLEDYYSCALSVSMVFYMPRPKKHYRTGKFSHILKDDSPSWHTNKPDRDNLEKAVLDCMTKAGVLKDDSFVCTGYIEKVWSDDKSGVYIKIEEMKA
jgi:crossover junction endodeoxyribonuclease RusA